MFRAVRTGLCARRARPSLRQGHWPKLAGAASLLAGIVAVLVTAAADPPEPGPCERAWALSQSGGGGAAELLEARAACWPDLARDPRVAVPGGHWVRDVPDGQRAVSLGPYLLDPFEVSVANYRACLAIGACHPDEVVDHGAESDCNLGAAGRDRHPVNCVTWAGAKAYCEWRGGHLPTEAELEYATGADGTAVYPWGWYTPTCDYANFRGPEGPGCGTGATLPIGGREDGQSPLGLFDLAGNVAEWAADPWVDPLPAGAFDSPVNEGDLSRHAARGGSWQDSIAGLGSRARVPLAATARDPAVGFRCAYEPDSTPLPAPSATVDGAPPELPAVRVPAGPFERGSERGVGDSDEYPQRWLELSSYRIGRLEVAVYEYRSCILAGGCRSFAFDRYDDTPSCNYGRPGYGQHPMNCVTWFAAEEFCHWVGGRLPTEAEWEKAARGVDARAYPWGNTPPECGYANHNPTGRFATAGCATGGTLPVGTFYDGMSPYGLFDMAGNVQEWVSDWYDPRYYALAPETDPPGPLTGSSRVVRGGSWNDDPRYLRSAYRYLFEPSARPNTVGFRCAWEE